jgi:hypothetical protein
MERSDVQRDFMHLGIDWRPPKLRQDPSVLRHTSGPDCAHGAPDQLEQRGRLPARRVTGCQAVDEHRRLLKEDDPVLMLRRASSPCPRPGCQQIRIGTRAHQYSRGP